MAEPLATTHPALAAEWSRRNRGLAPRDVSFGSDQRVWWICDRGHEWEEKIEKRARRGYGCPFCSHRRVDEAASLAVLHPDIAAEWHPTRNLVGPEQIAPRSSQRAWWRCPAGHVYGAKVQSRTVARTGCARCAGRGKRSTTSLALAFPQLAQQWHRSRNGEMRPEDVAPGSNKRVWWRCDVAGDHVWEATIVNRTKRADGCPFCSGRRASSTNNLAALHPEIAAEWHRDRNGALRPADVPAGSGRRVFWKCRRGPDHEWEQQVYVRTRTGAGCPFCAGQKTSAFRSLATEHPDVAAQWHPTRNGALQPEEVAPRANRSAWWKCPAGPDHEWRARIAGRAAGLGCPFCANRKRSVTNTLAIVRPDLAREWDRERNGDLDPKRVIVSSTKLVHWRCAKGHQWQARLDVRARGHGCPYCAGLRVMPEESLAALHPDIAEQWHPTKNGALRPDEVGPGSNRRICWRCPEDRDHVWRTRVAKRTKRGSGCPFCAGVRVCAATSLFRRLPALGRQWHPTKNGSITARDVFPRTQKVYWWKCPKGPDHEWSESPFARTNRRDPTDCPFCLGKRVSITNCLATLFDSVAREWHPNRNAPLKPHDVLAADRNGYWWQCARRHSWRASVHDRTVIGRGCPRCAG